MNNTLTARIEFSFKGEDYDLCSILDLDELLASHNTLPALHQLFARLHHIDTISYLYEVMESCDFEFSDAQGFARDFVQGTEFDADGFTTFWHEQNLLKLLQPIALRELNVADLSAQPALKNALVQAYQLGKGR